MPNPYQPPTSLSENQLGSSSDRIVFDGNVSESDIVALIRVPMVIPVLRVVALVTLLPFALMPIVMLVIGRSNLLDAIPLFMFVVTLATIVIVADRLVSRRRRARRLIKQHPALIGPFRGELNDLGLTFFNEGEVEFQQITWSAFPEVVVNDCGIRLDWRNQDYAFLAIPQRCIDNYDARTIRQQINRMQASATQPPIYQSFPDWSAVPELAIRFQNLLPIVTSARAKPKWWWAVLVACGSIGCTLLFMFELDELLVALVVLLVALSVAEYAGSANQDSTNLSWRQWGWLTPDGCHSHWPGAKASFQWQDPIEFEISQTHLLATFTDESYVFSLDSSDLLDDDWSRLVDWIAAKRPTT